MTHKETGEGTEGNDMSNQVNIRSSESETLKWPNKRKCGGCGVKPGERHDERGCDWEPCPLCGNQLTCCPCIYEMNGIDYNVMEATHPDIYNNGPTEEMYAKQNKELEGKWVIYSGYYMGTELAVEQGWYSYWGPPWVRCSRGHHKGTPDLNRAAEEGVWNVDKQRLVLR